MSNYDNNNMNNEQYEGAQYNQNYDSYNNQYYQTNEPKRPKKKKRIAIFIVSVLLIIAVGVTAYPYVGRFIHSKEDQDTSSKNIDKTKLEIQQVSKKDDTPNYVSKIVESVMPSIVTIASESYKYDAYEKPIAKEVSNGTGFIIQDNGDTFYIATNNHVVGGAKEIKVSFIDNTAATAIVKGADADEDLAVLEVKKSEIGKDTISKLKVAVVGKSSDLKIGDDVIAIGNALGYGQSVTRGIVSAVDRGQNLSNNFLPLIQTDAAINPGNSGGPLVNYEGQVVGINSIKLADEKIEGIGYAIPSDIFVPELNYLASGKDKATTATLGITAKLVTEQVSQLYNWPVGIYVSEVQKGSAADTAGIKRGDIITKFDGQDIINFKNLQRMLRQHKAGDKIKLTVYRIDGSEYDIDVVLDQKKGE